MQKVIISADSKPYMKGSFRAHLSAVIRFRNPRGFEEKYLEFMKQLFLKRGKQVSRSIYKSFDLGSEFVNNPDEFYEILLEFAKFLNGEDVEVNIVYTSLFAPKLPNGIKLYGEDRANKIVNIPKFIDILGSYYTYVPIWKLDNLGQDLSSSEILLDCFDGEVTRAWRDIESLDIKIIPEGDKCNAFVSSADLGCKFVDYLLKVMKIKLSDDTLNTMFENLGLNKFKAFYCGHQDLKYLVPVTPKKIKIENYYKSPMIFILKEGVLGSESTFLENSLYWDSILELAYLSGAGVKHIDYNQDAKKIRAGDFLICTGLRGEEQAQTLTKWGYKFNLIKLEDIDKKIETIKSERVKSLKSE